VIITARNRAGEQFRYRYQHGVATLLPPEKDCEMDRARAIALLTEISQDERFAAVLCRVTQYAVGKASIRTYWAVRVNPLNDRSRLWVYVETPGDWSRLSQETPR
jgi:hypothetical protein